MNMFLSMSSVKLFLPPFDVILSMTDVVQPDILFISKERLHIITKKNIVAAPDLVVEVLSDSTEQIDRNQKTALYAKHGLKESWLADAEQQPLELFVLEKSRLQPKLKTSSDNARFKSLLFKELTFAADDVFE